MQRIILSCRAHSAPIIAHAHGLGVNSFETMFLPQLGKSFPANSTVFLKTTSLTPGEIEFQARSFRAALTPSVKLVLMLLDPEFETTDVSKRLEGFFSISQDLCGKDVLDSYGVSSNGLSNKRLSLTLLKNALQSDAQFKHLQFPLNMMETGGLGLFPEIPRDWQVSTNRPLTAYDASTNLSYRLVEADFPLEYQPSLDKLLSHLTPPPADSGTEPELVEACAWLRNLFTQLDQQLSLFPSIMAWEQELHSVILPLVNDKFDELDEDTVQLMTNYFTQFGLAVRESGGAKAREVLKIGSQDASVPLQEIAFKYALAQHPRNQFKEDVKLAIHASTTQQVDDWNKWLA